MSVRSSSSSSTTLADLRDLSIAEGRFLEQWLNLLVPRYHADPTALATIDASYQTTGRLEAPLVTMHTTGDPVVPYWHEPLYTLKALPSGLLHTNLPVARYGLPVDIARIAAFLCSEDASYIVGQTIVADGGTTSLMSLISDFRSESSARFGKGYLPGV